MTDHTRAFLLEKWEADLAEFDGPGAAMLVKGGRWCVAGLIVRSSVLYAHHFRLHQDETVGFIERPDYPDAPMSLDPMADPCREWIYESDGVPLAVSARLDALEVTPVWSDACQDGAHEFTTVNKGSPYAFMACDECELSRNTLSWLGHEVSTRDVRIEKPDWY